MRFHFDKENIRVTEIKKEYHNSYKEGYNWSTDKEVPLQKLHIYQPINLPTLQQDGQLKFMDNVVPAFYLKAFDDKNAWSNLENAIWLTIDIVTTFTGVGNLLKLRHLRHLTNAPEIY